MRNFFLFSLLFIVISACLYAFFIRPQYDTARARYDHVGTLKSVLGQGEDLQALRDSLQSQINAIPEDKRNLVENAIPQYSSENIALFLLSLDKLVYTKSGLPLDTVYSLGSERKVSDTVILPVTFNFATIRYDLLRDFIGNLQTWGKGLQIQSVQISVPIESDTAERGFVQAVINTEVLFASVSESL